MGQKKQGHSSTQSQNFSTATWCFEDSHTRSTSSKSLLPPRRGSRRRSPKRKRKSTNTSTAIEKKPWNDCQAVNGRIIRNLYHERALESQRCSRRVRRTGLPD